MADDALTTRISAARLTTSVGLITAIFAMAGYAFIRVSQRDPGANLKQGIPEIVVSPVLQERRLEFSDWHVVDRRRITGVIKNNSKQNLVLLRPSDDMAFRLRVVTATDADGVAVEIYMSHPDLQPGEAGEITVGSIFR